MWRTERQPREVNYEHCHDAGEHTDLPTRARLQHSAPPRCHRGHSGRYERQPMEPPRHLRQPTHRCCQAHASRRPQHLRKPPRQPLPTAPPHPPLPPSAAPVLARSGPPPGDPCCSAAPAPNAPGATNQGDHRRSGPSWLPPWRVRPPTSPSPVIASRLGVVVTSAALPHHSRRLRHQRTASQAAALTTSSPTSQGQLLCTMATIHLSPIAIRSRPTPHLSRLPASERLESLIITISSKTANWVLVSPRPTHRRASSFSCTRSL